MLVPNHPLVELAAALNNVDQIINNPVLQTHYHVQVTQSYIGIDNHYIVAPHGQSGSNVGSGRGLAYSTLARGNNYGLTRHILFLHCIPRTGP